MDKEDAILRPKLPTSRCDSVEELLVTTSLSLGEVRARIANDVSRLDGARLGALVEVGKHKGTKDVVIVLYDSQRFDGYLRLKQGCGCYVLGCVLFRAVKICKKLFWAFSET